jgi:hypothetical protein
MAMNCVVWPPPERDCEPGIIASETTLPPATVPLDPVTVTAALEATGPANPAALAVIVVVPAPTAVAIPVALMVATAVLLDVQVTEPVMFCVDAWPALP